jgi:glycopeptide antibiotics resistance protein
VLTRSADVFDVVANIFGLVLGAFVIKVSKKLI